MTNDIEQKQKKKTADETSARNTEASPADAVGFTSEPFEFEYTFKVTRTFLTAFGLSISLIDILVT